MINLSVIIPCYNECENIKIIFDRIDEFLSKYQSVEFIIVDNGSTDNSLIIMNDLISKYNFEKFVKIVQVKKNIGYGYGILEGLNNASGEIFAWTHSDLQTDILDILKGYEIIKNNANSIVKGSRINSTFFSSSMGILASIILNTKLREINAQPKLFYKDFYNKYIKDNAPHDFSLDLYLLYIGKLNNLKIIEFDVHFLDRQFGEAKGGGANLVTKFKIILRTIKYIIKLRFKK